MSSTINKYSIKIPESTEILYDSKKNTLLIKGFLKQKFLKLKVKILVNNKNKFITVTSKPLIKFSGNEKKKVKALQGTTAALIKQFIIETSSIIYKKLNLVGVGYRAFEVDKLENKILQMKLGYSHDIFFKNPNNLKIFCLKFTKLFIYGNSYQTITQTTALIQSYKYPEPYKGKGILYENQKIILKEGKKV
jgi:large subunit ribosomal protein L6